MFLILYLAAEFSLIKTNVLILKLPTKNYTMLFSNIVSYYFNVSNSATYYLQNETFMEILFIR